MTTSSRRQRRRSARSPQQRRQQERARIVAGEPVDYSQDYAYVRHDLRRIALWSTLLIIGIIAVSFAI